MTSIRLRARGGLAAALLAAGCGASPGASPRDEASPGVPPPTLEGGFAYADSTGTQFLALGALANPAGIVGAVCAGGAVAVRHDRRQERRDGDSGRQVAANFGNETGEVFRVTGGSPVDPDGTCFLSPDSALLAGSAAVRALELSDCSAATSTRIAALRVREVTRCWRMAQTPGAAELIAVQFATLDTNALASIVVLRDSTLLFHDLPGRYRGPDEDIWRVDDQGVFAPENIHILFVLEQPGRFVLALDWHGTEGGNSQLLVADSSSTFREVRKDYRYWVPN